MSLEDKCVQLREKIRVEKDYWRKQKTESLCNGQDFLAADAHARVAAFCIVLSMMDKLGIEAQK